MMKARRTRSPFQQEISNPSEHHRRFERMTTTLPSWSRPFLRPVCRARSMPFCRIIRKIRLWLAIGFPVLTSSLLANAVMRLAVGRPLVDQAADQRQEVPVVRLAIRATRLR